MQDVTYLSCSSPESHCVLNHRDIAEIHFQELQYWLGFLDDVLSCDIRVWNARLVEWFMREVVVGTVLLRWNRSLDVIERKGNGSPIRPSQRSGLAASSDRTSKVSAEVYKARAETRVSIVFLTQ